MTEIGPVQPGPAPAATGAPAGAGGAGGIPAGGGDSDTIIHSVGDLREKAEKVYDAMVKGLAQSMIGRIRDAEERRRQIAKEYQR